MSLAVTFRLVLLQHCPRSHFLGPLRTFLNMFRVTSAPLRSHREDACLLALAPLISP
jgi:hypothetical protein